MTHATIPPLSLRPREAARALGISQRTLSNWTKAGLIPAVKIGRAVLYSADELRAWLARQSQFRGAPEEKGGAR